ncbi:MAG: hypothetical protein HY681_02350 [Chloroflexi bacterium]|nr:hypothetical protein [Chloroflexota bacterium]
MRRYVESNLALRRALFALADLRTVAAIGVLLVNDHILKHLSPSWLTGKLSDVMWSAFAPLLLAFFLALIVPPLVRRQERLVAWLAFATIGVAYALFNLSDAIHGVTLRLLSLIGGAPVVMERDATDVITLPGLLLGWWIWRRQCPEQPFLQARGLTIAVLAVMASVASGRPQPDPGIYCFPSNSQGLFVKSLYSVYESVDGGLTWKDVTSERADLLSHSDCRTSSVISDPRSPLVQYAYRDGKHIERSSDGGTTWTREFNLSWVNHSARARVYGSTWHTPERIESSTPGTPKFAQSPRQGIVDPATGNALFAMSLDGVLVRTADGHWRWATVGPYSFTSVGRLDTLRVLWDEWLLALVLTTLAINTLLSVQPKDFSEGALLWLAIEWSLWLLAIAAFDSPRSALASEFADLNRLLLGGFFLLTSLAIAIPHVIWTICRKLKSNASIPAKLVLHIAGILVLFYVPHVVWALGGLAQEWMASLFAVLLVAMSLAASVLSFNRQRQQTPSGAGH